MSKISDKDIIKNFIKLLENNLLFKGSPKGYSASSPYKKPTTRPIHGKSEYDIEDEDVEDEEDQKKKVKVAKYFSDYEDEDEK